MPRVALRTLTDPILFRLPLVARELRREANGTEQAHGRQVVRVTHGEIARRGFSSDDVPWLGATDRKAVSTCWPLFAPNATQSEGIHENKNFSAGPRLREDGMILCCRPPNG
jgi:hypothetical protein